MFSERWHRRHRLLSPLNLLTQPLIPLVIGLSTTQSAPLHHIVLQLLAGYNQNAAKEVLDQPDIDGAGHGHESALAGSSGSDFFGDFRMRPLTDGQAVRKSPTSGHLLIEFGIYSSAICFDRKIEEAQHARSHKTRFDYPGTPKDVGDVVALLCSEKARWITGRVIYAGDGASLMSPEVPTEIQIG